jgi:preprotein translocase subunit SecY
MSSELWRRVGFTIGALLVFRLGTYIPLPGLDLGVLSALFGTQSGAVWRGANLTSGGAAGRLAIFSLSLTPYLTAAILLQLLSIGVSSCSRPIGVSRPLARWRSGADAAANGCRMDHRPYHRLRGLSGFASRWRRGRRLVVDPGWLFLRRSSPDRRDRFHGVAQQPDHRTLGNGIALILLAGIVLEVPAALAGTLDLARRGLLSEILLIGIAVFVVALTALVVVMERAQRRLAVDYAPRQVGAQVIAGRSDLVFKLNGAGAVPVLSRPG